MRRESSSKAAGFLFYAAGLSLLAIRIALPSTPTGVGEAFLKIGVLWVLLGEYALRNDQRGWRRWPVLNTPGAVLYVLGYANWAVAWIAIATCVLLARRSTREVGRESSPGGRM